MQQEVTEATKEYVFQEYPKMLYDKNGEPIIVNSKDEEGALTKDPLEIATEKFQYHESEMKKWGAEMERLIKEKEDKETKKNNGKK